MLNRYEDVPQEVTDFAEKVRAQYFPELARARIAVLFDLKRRKSRGNWILASIHKPNELTRHFTKSNLNPIGLDYVIVSGQGRLERDPGTATGCGSSGMNCATPSTTWRPRATPTSWWATTWKTFGPRSILTKTTPGGGSGSLRVAESVYDVD